MHPAVSARHCDLERVQGFERRFVYIREAWVLSQLTPQSHQVCVSSVAFAAFCVLLDLPNLSLTNSACNFKRGGHYQKFSSGQDWLPTKGGSVVDRIWDPAIYKDVGSQLPSSIK